MSDSPGEAKPYTGEPEKPVVTKDKEESDPRQGLPPSVEVEYASGPMELKRADPNAQGPWIQYNGIATVRVMGPKEWASVGVDSDKYCEWSYMNKKRLPRSIFSDAELQYLLRQDGRFSLVEDAKKK